MGYYAHGFGDVKLFTNQSVEKIKQKTEFLKDVFDDVDYSEDKRITLSHYHERYDDDDVISVLSQLSKTFQLESGELEFTGEDDERWRFRYDQGHWYEDSGVGILYENSKYAVT